MTTVYVLTVLSIVRTSMGFSQKSCRRSMMNVPFTRSGCYKQSESFEHATTPAESEALQKDVSKFNNIQMARKIQLNSAYGAIGNQYFRYYNLANAEAITLSGQVSIRWIENKMNAYLNKVLKTKDDDYVIASDTDSIYLNLGPRSQVYSRAERRAMRGLSRSLTRCVKMEFEKYIRKFL